MFLANFFIPAFVSEITSTAEQIDGLPSISVALRCERRHQRNHVIFECIWPEGVPTIFEDLAQLVGVVIGEVDVSWIERALCTSVDVLHELRIVRQRRN